MRTHTIAIHILWSALLLSIFSGCYSQPAPTRPTVWHADDRRPILEPQEETEGQWALWDGTDKMIFYRVGQFLNVGRSFRAIGTWVGLTDPLEAQNINAFDEVPDGGTGFNFTPRAGVGFGCTEAEVMRRYLRGRRRGQGCAHVQGRVRPVADPARLRDPGRRPRGPAGRPGRAG